MNLIPATGIVGCNEKTFPTAQEPEVDWSDPREIRVSISVVYNIAESHDAVDGVHVTYNIGTVISRDCKPAKTVATRT